MTVWNKVAGDIGDSITVTLGGITNLDTVASVEAHVWKQGTTPAVLAAAVADAAACTLLVELGDDEGWLAGLTADGRWNVEYELTFGDGSKYTWPQMRPDEIVVRSDGLPPTP